MTRAAADRAGEGLHVWQCSSGDGYVAQIEGGLHPCECFHADPLEAAYLACAAELEAIRQSTPAA